MRGTKFAALAAVVLLATTGCQPTDFGNGVAGAGDGKADPRPDLCHTAVTLTPVVIHLGDDVGVTTTTQSTCVVVMTQHDVTLHLERLVKGQWTDNPQMLGGGGKRTCKGLPAPGTPATCRVTLHGCISGMWRARYEVEWARVDENGQPDSGHAEATQEYPNEIKCPGPEGSQ